MNPVKIDFGRVFAQAGALWRADRALLLPVAGMFLWLPAFAVRLFLPIPDSRGMDDLAFFNALMAFWSANAHWLLIQIGLQLIGSGAILVLLLAPDRPAVADALQRAVRLLPRLALAHAASVAMVMAGGLLVVVIGGLYALGRTQLVLPVVVAEHDGGIRAALARSRGNGWRLLQLYLVLMLPSLLLGSVFDSAADGASALAAPVLTGLATAVLTAGAVGLLLVNAAAYRILVAARQGI